MGDASFMLFKGDHRDIASGKRLIADLALVDYTDVLEEPLPLAEIENPYDVYKFACQQELRRDIRVGDIILLRLTARNVNEVFMLVLPHTFSEKLNRFFRMQRDSKASLEEYPMYLYHLETHPGFNADS